MGIGTPILQPREESDMVTVSVSLSPRVTTAQVLALRALNERLRNVPMSEVLSSLRSASEFALGTFPRPYALALAKSYEEAGLTVTLWPSKP